ncbi:hypothetical protein NC652_038718 [Populus alba x Populus x berolinensis]|nr:hypothetical protein NC652_038718 [Populus alba x Populus x berolinensis]
MKQGEASRGTRQELVSWWKRSVQKEELPCYGRIEFEIRKQILMTGS